MKFGKSLSNQIEETLPEWREKFLSYKELKKKLKLIEIDSEGGERCSKRPRLASEDCNGVGEKEGKVMTREENDFIRFLKAELEKFNSFFVEKEEEYIIRLKLLQDSVAKVKTLEEEMMKVREIVDFHGEMILLENYSAINYTGLVKILKKYEKRTGASIRLIFIQWVLQQPFFSTDLIYQLVKECEKLLDRLFPTKNATLLSEVAVEAANGDEMQSLYMKRTVSALRAMKEIRSGSSTVSVFSLPPLQSDVVVL